MQITSRPMKELWFRFGFPQLPTAPRRTERPGAPVAMTAGRRILVVDDDPLVLTSTSDMLRELGHAPMEMASPRKALEVLRDGTRPDLAILDYAMPEMSGLALAELCARSVPDCRCFSRRDIPSARARARICRSSTNLSQWRSWLDRSVRWRCAATDWRTSAAGDIPRRIAFPALAPALRNPRCVSDVREKGTSAWGRLRNDKHRSAGPASADSPPSRRWMGLPRTFGAANIAGSAGGSDHCPRRPSAKHSGQKRTGRNATWAPSDDLRE